MPEYFGFYVNVNKYIQLSGLITKLTKWSVHPVRLLSPWASTQSDQSSPSAWKNIESSATHWAHCEDSDQTGWMPRLIWVFAGCKGYFVGFVMRRLIWFLTVFNICHDYKFFIIIFQPLRSHLRDKNLKKVIVQLQGRKRKRTVSCHSNQLVQNQTLFWHIIFWYKDSLSEKIVCSKKL